jgi:hypothetical protein
VHYEPSASVNNEKYKLDLKKVRTYVVARMASSFTICEFASLSSLCVGSYRCTEVTTIRTQSL